LILVTGAAGFIGSHVVDRLIEMGHDVFGVDNLSTGKDSNINPKVKDFIIADIADAGLYPNIKLPGKHIDAVFHLAALARIQPSFKYPVKTYESNALGTINVLEFARQSKAKVIYPGSSSAYHDIYANPYTYTKFIGEEHCKMYNKVYGLPIGIARFFNVYGPRQIDDGAYATVIGIFEKQKREGTPLTITGNGEQRRDFTHVQDIVSGLIALWLTDHPAQIFNFGTGKNYSINEVADMFGGPTEYIPARPGEAWITLADISQTQECLGYKPRFDLGDYIKHEVSHLA